MIYRADYMAEESREENITIKYISVVYLKYYTVPLAESQS
jgi:hypothetical protein